MDSVYLASEKPDSVHEVDLERCILCQDEEPRKLTSTSNGRKRIKDAASIWKDVVTKRLMMRTLCTTWPMSATRSIQWRRLHKIAESSGPSEQTEDNSSLYNYRRLSTPGSQIYQKCNPKKLTCVICGHIKHNGSKTKYRISERDSATKFL